MKTWFENNWLPILIWLAVLGLFGAYFLELKDFLNRPLCQISVWQLFASIYVIAAIINLARMK